MATHSLQPWPVQFQTHPLLQGFTAEQTNFLGAITAICDYQPGDTIVREDETSDELYFIVTGEVELLKADDAKAHQYRIGTLASGAAFGEIAFINAAPRTCTIKALTAVQMLVVARSALEQQGAAGGPLLNQLKANIAHQLAGTLQDRTAAYVLNLQEQLVSLRTMNEFGQLFIGTVTGFGVATFMNVVLNAYVDTRMASWPLVSWSYLLLMLLPTAYFVKKSPQSWRAFGITWANWRRVTVEALIISGLLIALWVLLLWVYVSRKGQPSTELFMIKDGLLVNLLYLPHAYLQELIARGVMQNSLQRFFKDGRSVRAVLWSSTLFAIFHSHFGLPAIIFTFLSGLLFGAIFMRQQNLIGVAIVHWLFGIFVFAINLY